MPVVDPLPAMSRMFSAAAIRPLAATGRSALLGRLLATSFRDAPAISQRSTVGDALREAFKLLTTVGNRDDHVYRSALTQKLFLGRHSANTAIAIFEARASRSRADVVILNGTSTAYEIKSDRDSFTRLHDQLQDYRQVWATVNVVTGPSRVSEALALAPSDVGVISLTPRFTFETIRPAKDDPSRINPLLLLDSMRAGDAVKVVENLGFPIPQLPNTKLRQHLACRFQAIDPKVLHSMTLRVLKETRAQSTQINIAKNLPLFLRASALALPFDGTSYQSVKAALETPLVIAQQWS